MILEIVGTCETGAKRENKGRIKAGKMILKGRKIKKKDGNATQEQMREIKNKGWKHDK